MAHNVDTRYIPNKECFVRFHLDWFEQLINKFNTQNVGLNNPDLSPQEEMTQDLISIIQVFSCRIYGLRKYKIENNQELK